MKLSADVDVFEGTDRFTVRRCLGAGSFGTVYEVFDRERATTVALKVLRQADPAAIYRFKKEFRALADVTHPNLVHLHEFMSDGERWFFTMELIDGVHLLNHVRGATLTVLEASTVVAPARTTADEADPGASEPDPSREPAQDWDRLRSAFLQLAEGLSALHAAGQVHRDIKPRNVLVTRAGRVVILDFGLVAELAPLAMNESSGLHAVGTPAYMSPEQARGRAVREASDWYSVGVILYQALTGCLPFHGEPIDQLSQKLRREPASPRRRVKGIPDDLDRLCCELLRRDADERPSGAEILRRLRGTAGGPAPAPPRPAPTPATAPFIGRKEQLAALHEAYDRAKEGRAVTIVVRGLSGMGKSTLVRRFLKELSERESTCVILSGRCYERESMPYKSLDSLIDALTQYLKSLPPHDAEALLPRDVLTLARLFPVLRRVEAVSRARRRGPEIPDSQEVRRRAVAALRELLERLADRVSLVLFIDDLQWGDADGAALLSAVLRPPDPPPLLLIGCRRIEGGNGFASSAFLPVGPSDLEEDPLSRPEQLVVEQLSPEESEELAGELLGESPGTAETAHTIAVESRGNPFLLDELARVALSDSGEGRPAGPPTLQELIGSRILRLPEEARRLLEVLAVAGEPLERSVALTSADVTENAEEALSLLHRARLVRAHKVKGRDTLETAHDQVREIVVRSLPAETAKAHHRRLAHALETWGQADPEALAVHFHAAEELETASDYVTRAARQASEALAFDRAARLYLMALSLGSGGEESRALRVRLGDALANAGRGAEAAAAYTEAAAGASAAENLELRRRAADQLLRSGHVDRGLAAIQEVLKAVGMKLAAGPKRALLSLLFRRAWIRLRGIGFRERDASQVSAEELIRIDVCWTVGAGLGLIDTIRGHDFQSRQLLLALRAGEPYRVALALALEAGFSAARGGRTRRRTGRLCKAASSLATRIGHPHALGLATWASGLAAYLEGRWSTALQLNERAEGIYRERCTGVAWEIDNTQQYFLRSLVFMGRFEELSRHLPAYLKDARTRGDLYAETILRTRVSYNLLLAQDRPERARQEIREMLSRWTHRGYHLQHYYAFHGEAEIDLYEGKPKEAWERVVSGWPALERSLFRRVQIIFLESAALRARTMLAGVVSGVLPESHLKLAERDARRIEREAMPWSDPLAQLIRASVAALRGDAAGAVSLLASAESGFETASEGLHAAVARFLRGRLLGGAEGDRLMAEADAWMAREKVANPAFLRRMIAPGRWDVPATS